MNSGIEYSVGVRNEWCYNYEAGAICGDMDVVCRESGEGPIQCPLKFSSNLGSMRLTAIMMRSRPSAHIESVSKTAG